MRKTIRLGERDLAYREAGMGAPLVLLHAFPLNADMWEPQLAGVPEGWRLVAPDFRGFGGSRGPAISTLDEYARDVIDLLQALEIRQAVLGGLSMGGYVLFRLLRLAPGMARGLILADTRPQADTDEGRENRRRMQEVARERGAGAISEAMLPKLLADSTQAQDGDVVATVRRMIGAADPEAIAAALGAMKDRPDSTPGLGQIACPTLIIVGGEDGLTPVGDSELMQQRIPGATLRILPGVGHLASLEAPDAFNAALDGFLEGVRRT